MNLSSLLLFGLHLSPLDSEYRLKVSAETARSFLRQQFSPPFEELVNPAGPYESSETEAVVSLPPAPDCSFQWVFGIPVHGRVLGLPFFIENYPLAEVNLQIFPIDDRHCRLILNGRPRYGLTIPLLLAGFLFFCTLPLWFSLSVQEALTTVGLLLIFWVVITGLLLGSMAPGWWKLRRALKKME